MYGIVMATEYPVKIKVRLRPIGEPWVKIGIDNHYQFKQLITLTDFDYEIDAVDSVTLTVEHFNKHEYDPTTAVEIVGISFFGIEDPKFAWAGVYQPNYPLTWLSEQEDIPPAEIAGQTYLGWNGVYSLKFDVPVFTWIHQIQNLGRIY
jgi:hypothetical protein